MLIIMATMALAICWLNILLIESDWKNRTQRKEINDLSKEKMKLLEEINFLNKTVAGQRLAMYHLSIQNRKEVDAWWEKYKDADLESRVDPITPWPGRGIDLYAYENSCEQTLGRLKSKDRSTTASVNSEGLPTE